MVLRLATSLRQRRFLALRVNLLSCWLGMGLAFHLVYHGFPNPFRLASWIYVWGWPYFVVVGMIRWFFMPFAFTALLCLLCVALMHLRRSRRP